MSEENKREPSTVYVDPERRERADAIAAVLRQRTGLKVSRSAAIGSAIDFFFFSLCPVDMTDDQRARQPEPLNA